MTLTDGVPINSVGHSVGDALFKSERAIVEYSVIQHKVFTKKSGIQGE